MNCLRPTEVRLLLDKLGVRPSKALGQNFLVDSNILALLLNVIAPSPDDRVLEIGPGLGVITAPLAEACRGVVAVEKDRRLFEWLRARLAGHSNVELILGDMLAIDHEKILRSGITKAVSNLPYSTGSAILVSLLHSEEPPAQMILTLQNDVARRIEAEPGDHGFGLLSLWSQLLYEVTIRKIISPRCFYPAPGVNSAIIRMVRNNQSLPDPDRRKMFYFLTKFAFTHRRKQLKSVFRLAPETIGAAADQLLEACKALNIDFCARPEDLSTTDWLRMAEHLVRIRNDG